MSKTMKDRHVSLRQRILRSPRQQAQVRARYASHAERGADTNPYPLVTHLGEELRKAARAL
jgi:hypothetical protein